MSQVQFQNLVRLQYHLGKALLHLKTQQSQKSHSGTLVNEHNSANPLDISVPEVFRWLVHSLVNRHSNKGVWVAHILHSGTSLQIFGLNCIPGTDCIAKENIASQSYCSFSLDLFQTMHTCIQNSADISNHISVHLWSSKKRQDPYGAEGTDKYHMTFFHWSNRHHLPQAKNGSTKSITQMQLSKQPHNLLNLNIF